MTGWIEDHQAALYWLAGVSLALFVLTIVLAPVLLSQIPADYFTHHRRPPGRFDHLPKPARIALAVAKNAAGVLFILAGLAMLVLPGQGFLTLLIGFFMVDFPGKYRAERWLVSRPRVLKPINWLRRRRGVSPLMPGHPGQRS